MASSPSRFIKKRGLAAYDKHVSSRVEGLLADLLDAEKLPRAEHEHIPKEPGLYLFSDAKQKPIYVGQSRNIYDRLAQHCRPSSPENAASFAFNIAKREAEHRRIDIAGFHRKALSVRADFKRLFDDTKAQVALMPVQFIVEPHADLRTVFEVYATYALGTQEYNTFETH
jgi:predicted GIY-YIG superfamily endonuclease